MFYLDLNELDSLRPALQCFSISEGFLYSFIEEDYLPGLRGDLSQRVKFLAIQAGVKADIASIRLLTTVRIFNYVFNPLSLFICFDQSGQPICTVAEVGNTFGERKPYVLSDYRSNKFVDKQNKHFYVSPFSPLDQEFRFLVCLPGDQLLVNIASEDEKGVALSASIAGKRLALTDGNLCKLTFRYPLMTLRIITLIHWQAFRLWMKGIPYFRKQLNPHLQTGVINKSIQTGNGLSGGEVL